MARYAIFVERHPMKVRDAIERATRVKFVRELVDDYEIENSGRSGCYVHCDSASSFYILVGCIAHADLFQSS